MEFLETGQYQEPPQLSHAHSHFTRPFSLHTPIPPSPAHPQYILLGTSTIIFKERTYLFLSQEDLTWR